MEMVPQEDVLASLRLFADEVMPHFRSGQSFGCTRLRANRWHSIMIVGTASIDQLAEHAATIPEFATETVEFNNVVCFQLTTEMRNVARESQLPPALHPTVPAGFSLQAFAVGDSPWGAFTFATLRISCRSGVRARGFTRATVVDDKQACDALRAQFGFPARVGRVQLRHGYDGATIVVDDEGQEPSLHIEAIDPEPMAVNDVQYNGHA